MPQLLDTSLFSVIDTDSSIGVGWRLNFYIAGTSTRKNTYPTSADASAGTNANANPVVIDADGRLPTIWLADDADYKGILTDENDVVKQTIDQISGPRFSASSGSSLIGFIQSGTGAVSRSVESKLRDVVSVKDFGVTGDNTADDTAEIQAALNSGAKAVLLPKGTYKLTDDLTMAPGQTLYGEGAGSVLSFVSNNLGDNRRLKPSDDCVIRDIKVVETGVTGRNGVYALITAQDADNVTVERVEVSGSSSIGIMGVNAQHMRVSGCYVHDCEADGIHVQRGSKDFVIEGNRSLANGDDGIAVVSHGYDTYGFSGWGTVTGNICGDTGASAPGSGIGIIGAVCVTVTGNTIRTTSLAGIRITNYFGVEGDAVSGNHVIDGNNIQDAGQSGYTTGAPQDGILIANSRNVAIKDNLIRNAKGSGISVSEAAIQIVIEDNQVYGTGARGIWVAGASHTGNYLRLWTVDELTDGENPGFASVHYVKIVGNVIKRPTSDGIYFDGGTGGAFYSVIRGNVIDKPNQGGSVGGVYGIRDLSCTDIVVADNVIRTAGGTLPAFFDTVGATDRVAFGNSPFEGPAASVASAATVTLPSTGEAFVITGTTGITSIAAASAGRKVTLVFGAALTVTDGSNLVLAGNLSATGNTTLSLISDGANWIETGRSVN